MKNNITCLAYNSKQTDSFAICILKYVYV